MGSSGSSPGQFNQPKGLTVDQNNNVYVADEFNNRIQKFDSNGNFKAEFGQDGLNHPIDVAVDSQGHVYASDFDEILIYALSDQIPPNPPPETQCVGSGSGNIPITGTNGPDTLIGTSGNNIMNGLGANDGNNGCAGNDVVNGNAGNDGIAGGQGNDAVSGNDGNDIVRGDAGNDIVSGNAGTNTLSGGPGGDIFFCGPSGTDIITDFQTGQDLRFGTYILAPATATSSNTGNMISQQTAPMTMALPH